MSLFSKKPKSIADFEKEIEKLRHKKKLSARNSERLEEYEKQLSSLKTAEEAAQKKKARQKKIAIGSIAASVALITCIIIAGCISERGTVEPPTVSPGYTISDSSAGMTTPSDTSLDTPSSSETSESPATSNATTPAKESNFNANAPTIIVAAVTAVMKKKYLPSHIILGEDFGLKKPSMVLLEQIQTVNKDELTDYIGSVNDERLWKQINAALKKTFGLWIYNTDRNGDVRCLCPKCLSDYIHDPNYIVRRLDPFAKSKDNCDKCNNSGWDYIVYRHHQPAASPDDGH